MTTSIHSQHDSSITSEQNEAETDGLTTSDAAYERETTVVMSDGDPLVRISTAQRTVITALRKKEAFTETATGFHEKTEWAEFTIPRKKFNLAKAVKATRVLTDEQREELRQRAEHLAAYREANK